MPNHSVRGQTVGLGGEHCFCWDVFDEYVFYDEVSVIIFA